MTTKTRVYFEDSREITGSNELEDYTVYVDGRVVGTLVPVGGDWRQVRFCPCGLPIYDEEGEPVFPQKDRLHAMEDRILEHFNGRKVSDA